MNAANLEALRDHGDSLARVRDIEHWATFPSADARASFVDACLAAGFKLRGTRDPEKPYEGYSVHLFHRDIPDEDCVEQVTSLLIGLAAANGGEYDGWETELVW